jgi:hypothetical protein
VSEEGFSGADRIVTEVTKDASIAPGPMPEAAPPSPELVSLGNQLDAVVGAGEYDRIPTLMDEFHGIISGPYWEPPRFGWLTYLYIPAAADWRNYWVEPAPSDHLYTCSWTNPRGTKLARSDIDAGRLWAFAQALPSDKVLSCEAGLGVLIKPDRFAVYDIEPTIAAMGMNHLKVDPQPPGAGGTVRQRGLVHSAVWKTGRDGSVDLLSRSTAEAFSQSISGAGYSPVQYTNKPLSLKTTVGLEFGTTYLVGVVVHILINLNDVDPRGLSSEDFKVWASLECIIPQIRIGPR